MPGAVAPWLEDLDDDWLEPQYNVPITASVLQHIGKSDGQSRIPGRSSDAYSAHDGGQQNLRLASTARSSLGGRSILGEMNENAAYSRKAGSMSLGKAGTRSASVISGGSVLQYDTVERRAKSSSPEKKEATLEWRKRLVDGDVGYGDQTDLFGPSGLENIFQSPSKPSPTSVQVSAPSPTRLRHIESMPSSPPPWPSLVDLQSDGGYDRPARDLPQIPEDAISQERSLHSVGDLESHESVEQIAEGSDVSYDSVRLHEEQGRSMQPVDDTAETSRKISGQTEIGNEDFSPVFISKHTTLTGSIKYAPLDSQMAKLMQSASLKESYMPQGYGSGDEEEDTERAELKFESLPKEIGMEESMPGIPEVSLPDNLPTGTPPLARLGSYVTTQRGGLSQCGSFKDRPLSPSQPESRTVSTVIGRAPMEEVAQSEVVEPHDQRMLPATPSKHDASNLLSPPKTRPSASPLKLFGNYDTFTNKKLLRRMSQLEDLGEQESTKVHDEEEQLSTIQQSAAGDDYGHGGEQSPGFLDVPNMPVSHAASKLSSFGEGDLDEFDFEADLSFPSVRSDSLEGRSLEGSPDPDVCPPGATEPLHFHLDPSEDVLAGQQLKRKLSKRSTAKSTQTDVAAQEHVYALLHRTDFDPIACTDGKRPRSSPIKAPTPKRRRTLHRLEMDLEAPVTTLMQPQQQRKVSSKPAASVFDLIPQHDMLEFGTVCRPRNPTPSQRRQAVQAEIDEATAEFLSSSPRLHAIQEQIEASEIPGSFNLAAQAKAVATEVAAFTLNATKPEDDGQRKRSITTQDFLSEAMHIMSLIRARSRPQSGLGSVEESDEERGNGSPLLTADHDRSVSALRVSRPPSREGAATGWRSRELLQGDARVVSQLRKFEEKGDIDILDTTLHAFRLRSEEDETGADINPGVDIRISGPHSEIQHSRGASNASIEQQVDSLGSNTSGGYSTGRTMGSSSTRKSDNVATLAPETVAHLIPEEVAGMTFDKAQGRWMRMKKPIRSKEASRASPNPSSHLTSDDDPFGLIPDLTVDELREMEHIQSSLAAKGSSDSSSQPSRPETRDHAFIQTSTRPKAVAQNQPAVPHFSSSTIPSKYSAFASSAQQVETRATSWSTEHLARDSVKPADQEHAHLDMSDPFDLATEQTSHEHMKQSSPDRRDRESYGEGSSADESNTEELPPLPRPNKHGHSHWPAYSTTNRQVSLYTGSQPHHRNANCREQSEMSMIAELPGKRYMSVSVSVSRPPLRTALESQDLVEQISSPEKSAYLLSDLPEFTVHETDEDARPSERALTQKIARHAVDTIGDRYALVVQDLVKTLTDVQPEEPFWEDLRKLDLNERKLQTLQGLDDFCTRIHELDVSRNSLTQLAGAPISLRKLNANANALTSLTAWSHLMNLQYLDISNNQIDDLQGLSNLIHLRELRANNNRLHTLDAIFELEGLVRIEVKHNMLESVDFADSHLYVDYLPANEWD